MKYANNVAMQECEQNGRYINCGPGDREGVLSTRAQSDESDMNALYKLLYEDCGFETSSACVPNSVMV